MNWAEKWANGGSDSFVISVGGIKSSEEDSNKSNEENGSLSNLDLACPLSD